MANVLVVSSKVKQAAKDADKNIRFGRDAVEYLSDQVGKIVEQAVAEAKEDEVATVKDRHIKAAVTKLFGAQ